MKLRPAIDEDLPFVLKTWTRSYAADPGSGSQTRPRLVSGIRGTILDLLQHSTTELLVGCNEKTLLIEGFVCFDTGRPFPVLHYVYVKEGYRGNGYGSQLIAAARADKTGPVRYTFRTRACRSRLFRGAQYRRGLVCRLPSAQESL